MSQVEIKPVNTTEAEDKEAAKKAKEAMDEEQKQAEIAAFMKQPKEKILSVLLTIGVIIVALGMGYFFKSIPVGVVVGVIGGIYVSYYMKFRADKDLQRKFQDQKDAAKKAKKDKKLRAKEAKAERKKNAKRNADLKRKYAAKGQAVPDYDKKFDFQDEEADYEIQDQTIEDQFFEAPEIPAEPENTTENK